MTDKLNVLHLITKLELGGAQLSTINIIKKLNRRKYNVFLASGSEGILIDDARKIADTKIILLNELKHEISPFYDLLAVFKVKSLLKREKIDIIHTHSSKGGIIGRFAAKIAKTPVVIHTVHGFSFNDYQGFIKRKLFIILERIATSYTDRLIAVSTSDIKKGINENIANEEKYSLIRYGIAINRFQNGKTNLKKELGIPETSPVIGMIACLKPQKSPLDFVKVAENVIKNSPNAYFLLVGDGTLKGAVERAIENAGLSKNCILLGWRKDIPNILSIFDIFLLTSLWEGLPITILEAFAAGKPVVATEVDGIRDIVKNGYNGFLYPPKKTEIAANRVIELITNKELGVKMGNNARESLTKEFGEDNMVKQIEDLYEELANRKNTGTN